jgi:hypothetical protein
MKRLSQEQIRDLAIDLAGPRSKGYGLRPIPCDLDDEIGTLVDTFANATASERKTLTDAFGPEQAFGLMAYAERMAILAVRNRSPDLLKNGLLALVLEGFKLDARENIMRLALLDHSALKIGMNPEQLFEEAARSATGEAIQHLREFAGRSVEDKSIESMGYSEETTADGFGYSRNW